MERKYPAFVLLLLGILITFADSDCPNNQLCDCTSDYINCTCHQRERLVFPENTDFEFSGKEFIINGCGETILIKLSLTNLNVESVYLSDLLKLQIEPYAFSDGIITNFHISNIGKFILESQGFTNIKNITNLIISNVTLEKLRASVITDSTISNLSIKNSHIGTIEAKSLQLENFDSITIENSNIDAIEISAIRINNINKFSFIHNSVNSTGTNSISLSSVKGVEFVHCRFLKISSNMILTKDVDSFSFRNNSIRICEEKAFWGIQATKQIRFDHNQILMAKTDSLIPNHGPNEQDSAVIVSENNEIGCDCKLEWLLITNSKKYNNIKEKNVCHHPQNLKGLNLSLLTVIKDSDGNCSSINALTTTGDQITTIPTITKTEEKFFTYLPTMISKEDDIAKTSGSSTKQPMKDQLASCQNKQNSNNSSGTTCLCNAIILFVLLTISIF